MAALQPPVRRRRRPRRGSLERPINARLYRNSFLIALLPVALLLATVAKPVSLSPPSSVRPCLRGAGLPGGGGSRLPPRPPARPPPCEGGGAAALARELAP